MDSEAKNFMDDRKLRFEQPVPTLNQFLSQLYWDIKATYPLACKKEFPYKKWGQSASLKKRSFPRSLKSKFFEIVRSYVQDAEGIYRKDPYSKLGFWAPSGPA